MNKVKIVSIRKESDFVYTLILLLDGGCKEEIVATVHDNGVSYITTEGGYERVFGFDYSFSKPLFSMLMDFHKNSGASFPIDIFVDD